MKDYKKLTGTCGSRNALQLEAARRRACCSALYDLHSKAQVSKPIRSQLIAFLLLISSLHYAVTLTSDL